MQENRERRGIEDRRKKLTPVWSFYTFWGRRHRFRRKSDQEKGGYVDRYSTAVFVSLVSILGLNIFDSLLTMIILDLGGKEFNPLVGSVILILGDKFWIWKFGIVSFSLILLCLHQGFKMFRWTVISISSFYLLIVLYQVFLITTLRSPTP